MNNIKQLFWLYKSKMNAAGNAPVYLRITDEQHKFQISTGVVISPKNWDSKKQRVRGMSASAELANTVLKRWSDKLATAQVQVYKRTGCFDFQQIKTEVTGGIVEENCLLSLFQEHNDRIRSLVGASYSLATHEIYEITRREMQEFLSTEYKLDDISLPKLNLDFIERLEVFYRVKKLNQTNTIYKKFQRLNKVMNLAIKKGYILSNPFLEHRIRKEIKDVFYLTAEELELIEKKQFSIERIDYVKELFIFSCYTGLAYHEVMNLRASNCIIEDGIRWIKITRAKTGRAQKVPLLPKAAAIFEKYSGATPALADPTLFPRISNQKTNSYLKEISDCCGIKKRIHFHLARKTFATTVLLTSGVPMDTVSRLLGHSSVKITEGHYAVVNNEKVLKEMKGLLGDKS